VLRRDCVGYVLSRRLDTSKYRPLVISPRSYFVFTPLLNDCAVGTLEFRNVLESVRKKNRKIEYIQAWADDVNFAQKTVTVEPSILDPDVGHALTGERHGNKNIVKHVGGTGTQTVPTFEVSYDKLIIAVGCYSQTFGTKGVRQNALFLKDVGDARKIRRRVLELFELAILPTTANELRKYLLHFAIVGGGPTGMEFAAELSDLIRDDLSKIYPSLVKHIRISLYDVAPKVLPMFDKALSDYAVKTYKRQNIEIKTSHHITELRKGLPEDSEASAHQDKQLKGGVYTLTTKEEGDVGIGMCVWSTGNMANPFIFKSLASVHTYPTASAEATSDKAPESHSWIIKRNEKTGGIVVDDRFRVLLQSKPAPGSDSNNIATATMSDVFAIGDNAVLESGPLPGTAQVANQEALWLAKRLNKGDLQEKTFGFHNLGVMTYLGGSRALIQGAPDKEGKASGLKGWLAYLLWRGAYLTMTLSWRNKFLVPVHWAAVWVFGRDINRF
jgi:NADH dehydrogenase FAD-containing subunit